VPLQIGFFCEQATSTITLPSALCFAVPAMLLNRHYSTFLREFLRQTFTQIISVDFFNQVLRRSHFGIGRAKEQNNGTASNAGI
jgi:hypothetical protein